MFQGLLSRSRQWWDRLPAALPCSCTLCGSDSTAALCDACRARFFGQRKHRCTRCAMPLEDKSSKECGDCLKHAPAFDATIVASDYAPPADQLVLALKFGNRLELAGLFAGMLHDALMNAPSLEVPQRLIATPLGPQRLVERGFNQALEIAKPLSRKAGLVLDTKLVLRQRETQAQALLHPDERRKNIRGAFGIRPEAIDRLRGLHVGIVDDVITTGETLNELAATLKRFGAARVTNLVFARTVQK
ncbi:MULTISPECIES: ComF family protein [Oxalobacteraceae]|uniref:ComF family protein n=1 Tax=Oxalobacteraceae TaxID=75682 RepID=UPI0010A338FA|nr:MULTISPECIES: ComF family protein [Oxalobacteraceae]